jgi:serine phosphatase RsbU (regulator of sigma subunit)
LMESDETLFAQQQVVRLQALLEASRRIHSTIELDKVLRIVLEIVVRELELDGAFFTTFPYSYGSVPGEFLSSGFSPGMSEQCCAYPLRDRNGLAFTELVVLKPVSRTFSLDEEDFLESLALQSAVAIENARFHERMLQWQRVESDLASARAIQRSLLPQELHTIPGYSMAARSVTCYEVGGDYVDIVPLPSGDTIIVMADVAGKGLASALVGTSFRSAFRAMANSGMELVEIATQMNLLHYGEGEESRRRYVTAIFLRLSSDTNTLEAVNAGHNPAFLRHGGSEMHTIAASGTPVGMLPISTYSSERYVLGHGSRLLLYTDGLTEVFRGEEEFGTERLLDAFGASQAPVAEGVLDSLWESLQEFSDGQPQSDDMTALVLLRH